MEETGAAEGCRVGDRLRGQDERANGWRHRRYRQALAGLIDNLDGNGGDASGYEPEGR